MSDLSAGSRARLVSVVIPARDEAATVGEAVRAVLGQARPGVELEVLVIDDGSSDGTAAAARAAGARAIEARPPGTPGNPAAARNLGAAVSRGDPIVFLDADCTPSAGWLDALLATHDRGAAAVGGSLDLPPGPPGLPTSARCDYYCGWYLVHSRRPAGLVPHHPPPNLSVRRAAFFATSGFSERQPFAYTNEERVWQGELRRAGGVIQFEPRARAFHRNRPGYANLLRRNYRWAYTALPAKGISGAARLAWLYRHPWLVIAASGPLALAHTGLIVGCWLRAGVFEPLWMLPWILASRLAYAAGMTVGGVRWLRRGAPAPGAEDEGAEFSPRWQ